MNIGKTKQKYFEYFKIDLDEALKRALVSSENGTVTAAVEMLGETVIKKYGVFEKIWPNLQGYKKITSEKFQRAGVDYEVYVDGETKYIDLKVLVGPDYSMTLFDYNRPVNMIPSTKAVAIEIYQNDDFTNVKSKLTDYMLYIIMDDSGIYFAYFDYNDIVAFSKEHQRVYENGNIVNKGGFTWHTSKNGTGVYVKCPAVAIELDKSI